MKVPREPFIEAYERSDLSAQEVAERLGWTRKLEGKRKGDSTRVLRALGLQSEGKDRPTRLRNGYMSYDLAVKLCRALDADPVDLGV